MKNELGKPHSNPPDPGPKPPKAAFNANFDRTSIDKTPSAHSDPNHTHWISHNTAKHPYDTSKNN